MALAGTWGGTHWPSPRHLFPPPRTQSPTWQVIARPHSTLPRITPPAFFFKYLKSSFLGFPPSYPSSYMTKKTKQNKTKHMAKPSESTGAKKSWGGGRGLLPGSQDQAPEAPLPPLRRSRPSSPGLDCWGLRWMEQKWCSLLLCFRQFRMILWSSLWYNQKSWNQRDYKLLCIFLLTRLCFPEQF